MSAFQPNEYNLFPVQFLTRQTRLLLTLLVFAGIAQGQEIRRALPVQPGPAPSLEPQIRRALPVQPLPPAPPSPTPVAPPLAAAPPPIVGGSVNDTARFLAGLPLAPSSPLFPLTQDPAWQQHAVFFDQAWSKMNARQFNGISEWEASYFPAASGPVPVVFYFFSGPDFLYANQFFPNATTYILAGTEPIGPLPDVGRFAGPALSPVLHDFETGLNSVLRFSFFITKDMKTDLQRDNLKGTLPIFYVFLARAGKTITDITFVVLDKKGDPRISAPGPGPNGDAVIPGVRITFTGAPGSAPQTLYYFTTDLSDGAIHSQPGFMKFCAQQGLGDSLLKSASYLMFESGFSASRDFLLTHSRFIVQDDSGIPITAFDLAKWDLRLFGNYIGPIDLFKQYFQPQLQALYQASHPPELHFGVGYRWRRDESALIVAQHK
jgi:hypothetical protein